MKFEIKKAVRQARKAKIALNGVSGSGKTYSALSIADGLKNGGRVLVIDTENQSSSLYADDFDYDVLNLQDPIAANYESAINQAVKLGYDVLVIDSLTHAWEYLLDEVERVQKRDRTKNSFTAWAEVTPIYKRLVKAVVDADLHCICTFRAKSEYVMQDYQGKDGKTRTKPVKMGLAPIFRQGGEYEFDVVANIDLEHTLSVEKSRYKFVADQVIDKPTSELGKQIKVWLASGEVKKPESHYFDFKSAGEEGFKYIYDRVIQEHDCTHLGAAVYEFNKKVSLKTKDGTDKLEQFYIGQELPSKSTNSDELLAQAEIESIVDAA